MSDKLLFLGAVACFSQCLPIAPQELREEFPEGVLQGFYMGGFCGTSQERVSAEATEKVSPGVSPRVFRKEAP